MKSAFSRQSQWEIFSHGGSLVCQPTDLGFWTLAVILALLGEHVTLTDSKIQLWDGSKMQMQNSFCYFELVHYKNVTELTVLKDFWANGNFEAALCVFT